MSTSKRLMGTVKELYAEGIIRSCYAYTRGNERIGVNKKASFIYQHNIYNKDYSSDAVLPMKSIPLVRSNTACAKILYIELIDNEGDKYLNLLYMSTLYERKTMENFAREYIGIASRIADAIEQDLTVGDILS